MTYTYDGDGKRVEKSNGTIYWYGLNSAPLIETDLSNNIQAAYFFLNGKRVARSEGINNFEWYFADALGNARLVSEWNGRDTSDYYPFGGERVLNSSVGNQYKFTGKERDPESDLDNFEARYYSSQMGRFMSPDWSEDPDAVPYADLSDPQTLNLYSYVRNNPLSLTDPDGHHLQCTATTTTEGTVIHQVITCIEVPDISYTAVAAPFFADAEFGPPDWVVGLAALGTVAAINMLPKQLPSRAAKHLQQG